MTTITILIYTDKAEIAEGDDWGVTKLREILEAKRSEFVEFKLLPVVYRYQGAELGKVPAPVRIDEGLLKDVDQVWFFGFYQNNAGAKFCGFGSDQNEPTKGEMDVLKMRMNEHGLGVLVSGDHANPRPGGEPNDPVDTFICLGKAIGAHLPRAKQLRRWDGPPTNDEQTSFSTIAEARATVGVMPEEDSVPQKLALFNFAAGGSPLRPHRLFMGKDEHGQDTTIDILPDHPHEGEVLIPESLDADWPPLTEPDGKKKLPRPVVVALGFDRRKDRNCATPVLAVYDGDVHNVGRIVADSSWHHFIDVNLVGLSGDATPGSAFDLLGQFYRNLALYLAPLQKRQQIAEKMLERVRFHPGVMEERGSGRLRLGSVARRYLARVASPFEIAEMLHVVTPVELRKLDAHADFTTLAPGEAAPLPSQEEALGSIVELYHHVASERLKAELEGAAPSDAESKFVGDDEIVAEGIREAFRSHSVKLERMVSTAREFLDRLNQAGEAKEVKMSNDICKGTDRWRNTKLKPTGGPEEPDGRYEIRKNGSQFEGTHIDGNGVQTPLRNVVCGGVNGILSFDREADNGRKDIFYRGTIRWNAGASRFEIENGRFTRNDKQTETSQRDTGEGGGKGGVTDGSDSGDWEAQKPVF